MTKLPLLFAALLGYGACQAQPVWLTVSGDPGDPAVNTIQVDPQPVEVGPDLRTMRVRVSRSHARASWEGTPYRSYESIVRFDCASNTARYLSITYHAHPGWKGEPVRTTDYSTGIPRFMEFRDVTPNPNQRILRAACVGITRTQ